MFQKVRNKLHKSYKNISTKEHQLQYLFLEITRKCNLNCLHCGSDCKKETRTPELTTDSWLKIIDYIYQTFSTHVAIIVTGGEPFMHPDFETIINHLNNYKLRWGMVTNAMSLNKQKIDLIVKNNINSLTISADGMEKSHNKLRNHPKAYQKLTEALTLTGQTNIKYKDAVTCVYPDNLNELDKIAKLLIEKKMTSWRLFRIFPSGRAKNNPALQLTFEQTQKMVDWIKTNKKQLARQKLNVNLSCEGWLPFELDTKVRDFPFFCRAGINIASILADGNITGCTNNHSMFYQGNILYDNFFNVWQNRFQKFRQRTWIKQTDCQNCEYLKYCQGNSIHLWEENNKKPNFCYVKKIT